MIRAKDDGEDPTQRAEFVSHGKSWLLDHGYLDNHLIFDDVILNLICCSKHIKDATLDLNEGEKWMTVNLFLSTWSFFVASKKKLANKIHSILHPLSFYYRIRVKFYRYKGKKEQK